MDPFACSRRARNESMARWRALKSYTTRASKRIPLGSVEKFTASRESLLAVANSIARSPADSHDEIEKASVTQSRRRKTCTAIRINTYGIIPRAGVSSTVAQILFTRLTEKFIAYLLLRKIDLFFSLLKN